MVVSALQKVRPRPGPPETLRALFHVLVAPCRAGVRLPRPTRKRRWLVSACLQHLDAFGPQALCIERAKLTLVSHCRTQVMTCC